MKITTYSHACFTLEQDGRLMVVDPGAFSPDFQAHENTDVILISHNHADHLNEDHIVSIVERNPDVLVVGPDEVIRSIESPQLTHTKAVLPNQEIAVGAFEMKFFGGSHAVIHPDFPLVENIGVLVNGSFYYPGDSLIAPEDTEVKTLALPLTAPWSKISETIDFLRRVKPARAFPVHDAILSSDGKHVYDQMISGVAEDAGIAYERIAGNPIDV